MTVSILDNYKKAGAFLFLLLVPQVLEEWRKEMKGKRAKNRLASISSGIITVLGNCTTTSVPT